MVALLVVASAIVVFNFVNAQIVSHSKGEIENLMDESGNLNADYALDAAILNGDLTAAGIRTLLAQSGGGGGQILTTWGSVTYNGCGGTPPSAGVGAPVCPAGWTQVYAGYGPSITGNDVCINTISGATSPTAYVGSQCPGTAAYTNTCRVCIKD